jgi:hypothetical protein
MIRGHYGGTKRDHEDSEFHEYFGLSSYRPPTGDDYKTYDSVEVGSVAKCGCRVDKFTREHDVDRVYVSYIYYEYMFKHYLCASHQHGS